jgi:hypothetical protein
MATSSQDAVTFGRNLIATINSFLTTMNALNTAQDRMEKDPNLAASTAAALATAGRPGLTAQNFVDVGNSITQIQFTLDSGTPPQIAAFYAVL